MLHNTLLHLLAVAVPTASAFGNLTSIIIESSRDPRLNSTQGSSTTFTGTTWIDVAHTDNDTWIGHVTFTPSARTFWNRHEKGQLLKVVVGSGWIADRGKQPQQLRTGDIAWCPPGTVHWHGADPGIYMVHLAAAFGVSEWLEEVTGYDYMAAMAHRDA